LGGYIQGMATVFDPTAFDSRQDQSKLNGDLLDIAEQIHQEYDAQLGQHTVDECLHRVAARFDNATVRSFVPLLVRRYVRDELRGHLRTAG
jgi:hypothetical protein